MARDRLTCKACQRRIPPGLEFCRACRREFVRELVGLTKQEVEAMDAQDNQTVPDVTFTGLTIERACAPYYMAGLASYDDAQGGILVLWVIWKDHTHQLHLDINYCRMVAPIVREAIRDHLTKLAVDALDVQEPPR